MQSKPFYRQLAKLIASEPIDVAWRIYFLSLPNVLWESWQLQSVLDAIKLDGARTVWNWCRGAGKTEKASVIATFLNLRGYIGNWYAKSRKQLARVQECWANNPYVNDAYARGFSITPNRTMVNTIGKGFMTIGCLDSMENASGPHPDFGMWDEVALMNKEIFMKSLKILNHNPNAAGLFFSTPIRESIFHDISRKWGETKHTYLDCSFMDHKAVKDEQLPGLEWMWLQENMCEYTASASAVFPPITYVIDNSRDWPSLTNVRQGVDFGGGKPHTAVRIGITQTDIYLLKEDAFKYKYDDDILQHYCNQYPTEIEEGGANETMGVNLTGVSKQAFTNDSKYAMIGKLLSKRIHIDKALTPKVLKDMLVAVWDRTSQGKPRVETGILDYLAALMHAANCDDSRYLASPYRSDGNRLRKIQAKRMARLE